MKIQKFFYPFKILMTRGGYYFNGRVLRVCIRICSFFFPFQSLPHAACMQCAELSVHLSGKTDIPPASIRNKSIDERKMLVTWILPKIKKSWSTFHDSMENAVAAASGLIITWETLTGRKGYTVGGGTERQDSSEHAMAEQRGLHKKNLGTYNTMC